MHRVGAILLAVLLAVAWGTEAVAQESDAAESSASADNPAPAARPAADPVPVDEALPQPQGKTARDERLWTCETSISGEGTEVNYVRDAEFRQNVGKLEKSFSGWGRISCPGYVTLREILRRNDMPDDGSYCLLWDQKGDTYIGAQKGPRKGNALCRKILTEGRDKLEIIAQGLLEYETLSGEEIKALLRGETIVREDPAAPPKRDGGRRTSVPTAGAAPSGPEPQPGA